MKLNIPTTPGPLYDKEQVYKFTETPTPMPNEKKEMFLFKNSNPPEETNETKIIWPPPAKLRAASSMLTLNMSNGDSQPISNKLSQSSFYLNKISSDDAGLEVAKTKRKKWYKMFMPPAKVPKEKMIKEVVEEQPEINEPKDKRPWYKIKKKKNKQKHKLAVACES